MNKAEWFETVADYILDNVEDFYSQFYGQELSKTGQGYRLEPCPVCSHKGCCSVNTAVHCFSCDWKGTHINAWITYAENVLSLDANEATTRLADFAQTPFPNETVSKDSLLMQKKQKILSIAETFYHSELMTSQDKYTYSEKADMVSPLKYLTDVRKRKLDTIISLRIGFSSGYLQLRSELKEAGFSDEEIKGAGVWIPEGLFVFFYRDAQGKNILRINTKNPFNSKAKKFGDDGSKGAEEVIKGYSVGDKVLMFSPGFSFKKDIAVVEGEHDLGSLMENGCRNVCCIGGNIPDEALNVFNSAEGAIYAFFDNDAQGAKYVERFNNLLPHKKLFKVKYPETYNDPDEYFKSCPDPTPWASLASQALALETDEFKIINNKNVWVVANRTQKLDFTIKKKNDKGQLVGQLNLYIDDKFVDRDDDVTLLKCKARMKPMNFKLADELDQYYNGDMENKTVDELVDCYSFTHRKNTLLTVLAHKLFEKRDELDSTISNLKLKLQHHHNKDNIIDAVLKEINNLQNQRMTRFTFIPRMKMSQFFHAKNNDAYFYFNMIKNDGDAVRMLPYMLRNDRGLIRLDILKRKDHQCLILIDNKYELPNQIESAQLDLSACSLMQEHVERYIENKIPEAELSPYAIVRGIEQYIRRFYRASDSSIYTVLALYAFGTYFYELFGVYPYLHINGEKGSGKSVLDSVLKMFCFNARSTVSTSEAALFRMAAEEGGTIILDEIENLTSRSKSAENASIFAAILKGGYKKGSPVNRYNAEKKCIEFYDTYCPKIISNIFGLEDVISDRCLPIDSYRMKVGGKENRLEDTSVFFRESPDEVKYLTSKCCLSALENFQKLFQIFNNDCHFDGSNARLSEIITPLLALAKLCDSCNPDKNARGEIEEALKVYYENNVKLSKSETESMTPEGIIKDIIPAIARELYGLVPLSEIEYTNSEAHKFKSPILCNKEEGWFDLSVIHLKGFIEEHTPGESAHVRITTRWLKTVYKFAGRDIKRKYLTIDNEDLSKEFKGNSRTRASVYRFYFKDFIDINTAQALGETPAKAEPMLF